MPMGTLNTEYDAFWKEINGYFSFANMAEYNLYNYVFIVTKQERKDENSRILR